MSHASSRMTSVLSWASVFMAFLFVRWVEILDMHRHLPEPDAAPSRQRNEAGEVARAHNEYALNFVIAPGIENGHAGDIAHVHRARDLVDRSIDVRDLEIASHVGDDRLIEVNTHGLLGCEDRARCAAANVENARAGVARSASGRARLRMKCAVVPGLAALLDACELIESIDPSLFRHAQGACKKPPPLRAPTLRRSRACGASTRNILASRAR